MVQEILIDQKQGWGLLTLNRPQVLNALSINMMETLATITEEWANNDAIHGVMITGAGARAFGAGGDLRRVYEAQTAQDFILLEHLFRTEYTFTIRLHEFTKPYIAFIQGICMGGGLGAAVHGSHRVIAPDAVVAMPEVAIGYFPDVGGAWFLNRCPGMIGLYLALTGEHIRADAATYAGIAIHYVRSEDFQLIHQRLLTEPNPTDEKITDILQSYSQPYTGSFLEQHRFEIDELFAYDELGAILERLRTSSSPFARNTLNTILKRSPTSLSITFEMMKQSRHQSFRWIMNTEFALSQKFIHGHDFHEGIRAAVIDKDRQPKWQPANLDAISKDLIEDYFAPYKGKPLV
jgi:enoyl-CoA hydratase/carnithine racemase